jgi:hypothetical protein
MPVAVEHVIAITNATTTVYRKGPKITHNGEPYEGDKPLEGPGVWEVWGYPLTPEDRTNVVDVHFVDIRVEPKGDTREMVVLALDDGVFPENGTRLGDGPSYLHLGAEFGEQETALRFMALGHQLGLWQIVGPASLGVPAEEVARYVGLGLLYAIGWRQEEG